MKLRSFWGILTIFLAVSLSMTEGISSATVLEKKTIKRKVDPLVMEGKLAREVIGVSLRNLRLYAYRDGKFEPILFQIDEMNGDNGDWIMTGGPIKSVDLSNGKFDTWDKLLFMADDSGDKASKDAWIAGYTKASEIEIVDPLTGEKGWVYFLYFASNPPAKSSQAPYVTYDYKTEIFESDIWGSEYIITKNGLHSTYYKRKWNTVKSGGNGENYVDRLKIRPTFKVLGVPVHLNEEGVMANVIAHQIGPIRLIRRLEQYAKVLNVPALRVVEDVTYCRYTSTVPVQFEVPYLLHHPKRLGINVVIRFGTDYAPSAIGSMCYSSTNPHGFVVDGKMDDGEENFNPAMDNWRLITGDFGTFITRTILMPETKENIKITMGIIDDITFKHAPENYPGCIGYVWQDWDFSDAARGAYHLYVEFYHMEKYKPGDEVRFLNYLDHPIKIRANGQEGVSQLLLRPDYEKRYKKHYEPKDIEAHLKKNPM